jgi:predicted TIM-barrel fold metal-dependent hydrolase
MPTRRVVLGAAALLPATTVRGPKIVDCHAHCFDGPASTRFPYHPQAPYRPPAMATPEQLLSCMDGAGVANAVVVHPEPYQEDHRYLEHCLAVGKGRLKGTCHFLADRPGWQQAMLALVKKGGIVAARVHAYVPERLPPFGKPALRALWKQASELGLVMQIHFEPHYAAGFEPLIEEFKTTPVLVDNLGRPLLATPDEFSRVVRWARLPHVHMKLSGLPPVTEYPYRDVKPIIRELISAYGPSRMVWGGAFAPGATAQSYRAGRETIQATFSHLSATDQAEILGGTAARLFKLG